MFVDQKNKDLPRPDLGVVAEIVIMVAIVIVLSIALAVV